jgi:xanthine dehydrogenase iron-sulfur cluster and FAD-binding subunit A
VVAGATDLGLEVTKRFEAPPLLISLERIPALRALATPGSTVQLGATASLTDVEDFARDASPLIERMLRYFGSRQIKNRATLGGNLCTASPIGDLAPVLLALDAEVVLTSRVGERRLPLSSFFLGYRKTALRPGEIRARVEHGQTPEGAREGVYKVSKRRELDICTVSSAFRVVLDASGRVKDSRIAYGGMAATPIRCEAAEKALVGAAWSEEAIRAAAAAVRASLKPLSDHRGSAWYRMAVGENLLRGFYFETLEAPMQRLPDRHTATVLAR